MGTRTWFSLEGHGLYGKTGGQGAHGPVCLQGLSSLRCLSLHSGSRITLWSAADRDRSFQQVQSTGAFKDSTHAPWEAVSQHRAQNLGSPSQPQRPWATCWDRDPQHPPHDPEDLHTIRSHQRQDLIPEQ